MPRRPRIDRVGLVLHVFDRGIARRPVFETRADVRYFLACLAAAVRRGDIEILAFAVLTTHFHLLVRSPIANVSEAMRRVLNEYVRYFNRTRRRDGALFRGRYGAKIVGSLRYRWILLRYIDDNPVEARLAQAPTDYPYGSAHLYARARRPKWLSTTWVDDEIRSRGWAVPHEGYEAVFGRPLSRRDRALAVRRLRHPVLVDDDLDDLIAAAPSEVVAWMRRKASLADRTWPGLACVDAVGLRKRIDEARRESPRWDCASPAGRPIDAWAAATALLLRNLAGLALEEIASPLGISAQRAGFRVRQATELLADAAFAARVGELSRRILDDAHPRETTLKRESDSVRNV